ncbi:hypothetical protein D3C78_959170 [compost metagenome]
MLAGQLGHGRRIGTRDRIEARLAGGAGIGRGTGEVVDEAMRRLDVLGLARDRHGVDEDQRALLRGDEAQRCARRTGLQHMPAPGQGHAQPAVGQRLDVGRVAETGRLVAQGGQVLAGLVDLPLAAVRQALAPVVEQQRHGFQARIEQADAALGQLRTVLGIEQQAPAVLGLGAQGLDHLGHVQRQADGPPQIGHRVTVVLVETAQHRQQVGVDLRQVGQPGRIQRLQTLLGEQCRQLEMGGKDHVVADAGEHVLARRVGRGLDADAGLLLEVLDHPGSQPALPAIHPHHVFLRLRQTGSQANAQSQTQRPQRPFHHCLHSCSSFRERTSPR